MKLYAEFSEMATNINVAGKVGMLNGYKLMTVWHNNRKINLRPNDYYYVPNIRALVSQKGAKAKVLTVSQEGYNLQEHLPPPNQSFTRKFKADAASVMSSAFELFHGE